MEAEAKKVRDRKIKEAPAPSLQSFSMGDLFGGGGLAIPPIASSSPNITTDPSPVGSLIKVGGVFLT